MNQNVSWAVVMFMRAKQCADYWKEFRVGLHKLALARYKLRDEDKRSRYSLFVFRNGAASPERCFNFEPDDFEGQAPVAFFGEHMQDGHSNYGLAPNDLTIERFQPRAFEWAAKVLGVRVQDIVSSERVDEAGIPPEKRNELKNIIDRLFGKKR